MSHDRYRMLLPDYAAGLLDSGGMQELEEHLGSCDSCRASLAVWRKAAGVSQHRPEAPSNYFATLLPRIRERIDAGRAKEPLIGTRFLAPLGALAVVIVFALSISVNGDGTLRSVLGSIGNDELTDVAVDEAEQQSLYLIPSSESLASVLPEQVMTEKLVETLLSDNTSSALQSVADLSDSDVEVLLERLGERTIL